MYVHVFAGFQTTKANHHLKLGWSLQSKILDWKNNKSIWYVARFLWATCTMAFLPDHFEVYIGLRTRIAMDSLLPAIPFAIWTPFGPEHFTVDLRCHAKHAEHRNSACLWRGAAKPGGGQSIFDEDSMSTFST
jgi:hypothetical protein